MWGYRRAEEHFFDRPLTPGLRVRWQAFSKYGDVLRCEMSIDNSTGWSKGFGFVSFSEVSMADAAIAAMNGSWLAGKQMKARSAP